MWDLSSAGRASALQAEGHRFEPCRPHSSYDLPESAYNKNMDGFPSGQRGQTVNLLQIASVVRIHHHPYAGVAELADAQDLKSCERKLSYRFDPGPRHNIIMSTLSSTG